jgi:hypothetical protein
MTSYLAARKALYRRMFAHLDDRNLRVQQLGYCLNRLDNGQIKDILDLLDNDPDNLLRAERRGRPARKRS